MCVRVRVCAHAQACMSAREWHDERSMQCQQHQITVSESVLFDRVSEGLLTTNCFHTNKQQHVLTLVSVTTGKEQHALTLVAVNTNKQQQQQNTATNRQYHALTLVVVTTRDTPCRICWTFDVNAYYRTLPQKETHTHTTHTLVAVTTLSKASYNKTLPQTNNCSSKTLSQTTPRTHLGGCHHKGHTL